MTYQLDIARTAKRDRDEAYEWYQENYSKEFADKWYLGLAAAIRSLAHSPRLHGLVHENDWLSMDCRELLVGKSKRNRHRVVFTIQGDTVYVLRIWHSAKKDLQESDLASD